MYNVENYLLIHRGTGTYVRVPCISNGRHLLTFPIRIYLATYLTATWILSIKFICRRHRRSRCRQRSTLQMLIR